MAHFTQTGRAAAVLLPALLAALLGCTSDGDTPPGARSADPSAAAEAQRVCTLALKGAEVASATPATLGEIRSHGIGGGGRKPAEGAFGTDADGDVGAWCWTRNGPKEFTSYGVGADGSVVLFASIRDFATVPSGAPVIP